jgi:hypothetical protein
VFFCLNTKEPKSQGCAEKAKIFFFGLKEKSKSDDALLELPATDLSTSANNLSRTLFFLNGLRKKFLNAFSARPVKEHSTGILHHENSFESKKSEVQFPQRGNVVRYEAIAVKKAKGERCARRAFFIRGFACVCASENCLRNARFFWLLFFKKVT